MADDVLAAAPDCIKLLSATGQIRYINEQGLRMLEADSLEEVIGQTYVGLWPAPLRHQLREAVRGAASGGHTTVEGLRYTLKHTPRWWEVHFHGLLNLSAERGIICIARDITERHEREVAALGERARVAAALAESERSKATFIATLAHELRNPLAPVRSGLQVLKHAPIDGVTVERVRDVMERQVNQIVHLVDDLLDVARVSSGRIRLACKPVDLRDVVASAVEDTRHALREGAHQLNVALPPVAVTVNGDAVRLVQVVTNLLLNAGKFTAPNGRLSIAVSAAGTVARIEVADSGMGIEEKSLVAIFDMFTTTGRDVRGLREGLGIGLSLAKRLIEMQAGSLTAHSEGPGRGSRFVITLPLATAAAPPAVDVRAADERSRDVSTAGAQRQADAAPPAVSRRVLLVDDNVDAASTLSTLLEWNRHEVRVVHSGAEALAVVAQFRPEIIILDIGMAGMNGYEVAKAIRKMPGGGAYVLVALTGWGSVSDRARAKAAGFDEHLTKPVDVARIEAILARD